MNTVYGIPTDEINYISHHGVLGQKWGVQHGPPYPLDPSVSTGNRLKTENTNKTTSNNGILTEIALITAIYTLPVVAVAVPTAIASAIDNSKLKKKRKERDQKITENYGEVDPESGLHKQKVKCSQEENIKRVNPGYKDDRGTETNCVLCSITYELRNRGFEVTAKTLPNAQGVTSNFEHFAFKNAKQYSHTDLDYPSAEKLKDPKYVEEFHKQADMASHGLNIKNYDKAVNYLSKEKNSRGLFFMQWGYYGGHCISYEVKNGKVTFIDTQNGKIYTEDEMRNYCRRTTTTASMRIDNKEPNYKFIKDHVVYEPGTDSKRDNPATANTYDVKYEEYKQQYGKINLSDKIVDKNLKKFNNLLNKAKINVSQNNKNTQNNEQNRIFQDNVVRQEQENRVNSINNQIITNQNHQQMMNYSMYGSLKKRRK